MLSLAKKREQSMHYYEWQSKQNAKLIFFLKTTIAITTTKILIYNQNDVGGMQSLVIAPF